MVDVASTDKITFDTEPSIRPSDVHVLLADDEKLSRVVISNLLRRCGYTVTAVENGTQAVTALHESPPGTFDLVMSDVAMPGLSGPELLSFIRKSPGLRALPVVMMSAHEQAGTVFECIRRGAEDYLLKPVTLKEVQHIWQHVWRRRLSFQRVNGEPSTAEEDEQAGGAEGKQSVVDICGGGDEPEDGDTDLYTVEEMRMHCMRQIERYQKVLSIIDTNPELFS